MTPLLSRKEDYEVRLSTADCLNSLAQDSPVSVRRALLVKEPGQGSQGGTPHPHSQDIDCSEGPGLCAHLLTFISIILILTTLPLSLLFVVKVVQEYERAVIFRLGRLLSGGARGPGVFFIIPCVDIYEKIDMRTQTFDVPPQEVGGITE